MDSGSQFPERQEGTQPHQQGDPRSANLLQQRRRENTRFTGGYQPSGTQGDSTPITDTDYSLHLQQEQTGGPSHQQQMQREIPDKLIGPEPHALSSHSNAPSSPFGSSSLSDNTENWRRNPAGSSRSPGSYDTLQMPDTPTQRSDSSLSHHVYRQAPFAGSNPAGPSSPGLEQSLSQTRTQEIPTMHTDSPTERIPWQNHELETLIDTVHKLRKNNRNAKPDGELIKKLRENRLDSREANVVREILKRERINYTSATGKYILDYSKPTTKEKRLKTAQKRNILGPDGKPNVRALIKAQNADLAQKRNILGPDGKPDVRALRKAQNADLAQRRNILGPDGKPNVPALKKAQDANTLKKAQDEGYKNLYD